MVVTRSATGRTVELQEVPEPERRPGEVKIQVRAASVNRADLAVVAGSYVGADTGTGPVVVGLDAAGVIIEAEESSALNVGDRVMTIAAGGLAERVSVDARLPIKLPDVWSCEDGAAAVVALMTSHNALHTAGGLAVDEMVFLNAATSGVGQMAIKVARALGAGRIVAGARGTDDADFLQSVGADVAVDTSGSFADDVLAATNGAGADVIVDHVGGPYLGEHVRAAALKGRIVSVGRLGGAEGTLNMEELAVKRLEIVGVTFRTRTPDEKAAIVESLITDLGAQLATDDLKPRIDRVASWLDVLDVHRSVSDDAHLGKIVLQVS